MDGHYSNDDGRDSKGDGLDVERNNMRRLVNSIIETPYLFHPISEWVKFSTDKNINSRMKDGVSAMEVSPMTPQGRAHSESTDHRNKLESGPLWKLGESEHQQIIDVLTDQYSCQVCVIPWCILKIIISAALEGTLCSYWTGLDHREWYSDEYEGETSLKKSSPVCSTSDKKDSKSYSTRCDIYKPLPGCRTDLEKGVKNEMFLEKFAKLSRIIRLKSSPPFTIHRLMEVVINAKSLHPVRVWSWSRAIEKCITGVSNMDGNKWNELNDTDFFYIKNKLSNMSLMNDSDYVTPYLVRSPRKPQLTQSGTEISEKNTLPEEEIEIVKKVI